MNRFRFIVGKLKERIFFHTNIRLLNKKLLPKSSKIRGARLSGNLNIGENTKFINGVHLQGASDITIGDYTSINGPGTDVIANLNSVKIGSFCSIARGVNIQESNHQHKTLSTYTIHKTIFGDKDGKDFSSKGDIIIGNDVWIGAQSIIVSGAKIGNGAIIGANSLVNTEIPPYAIAVGSPAKVVSYRFSNEIIERLESIEWWNWNVEKIKRNKLLFEGELTIEKLNKIND